MLTVKINCQLCGAEFDFSPQDYTLKGLSEIPKRCPACCDKRAGVEKIVVARKCVKNWDSVFVSSPPASLSLKQEGEADQYIIYGFGGRDFGVFGGASFSHKWLIYINKKIVFPAIVNVRLMEKTFENNKLSNYIVFDPSNEEKPTYYLYLTRSWNKTTLKGFGKDRHYKEYLSPLEGDEYNYEVLAETVSGARSGRYGNLYSLVITDRECKIIGEGIK